jgi:hypothetical protein
VSELAQIIIAASCGTAVVLIALGVVISAARNRKDPS